MKIIFVYHAKSGLFNAALDIAHKVIQPKTYACHLCTLTHGNFTEKQAWKAFRDTTNHDLTFYHFDEFETTYKTRFPYPVVLQQEEGFQVLLSADEISSLGTIEELIQRIHQKTV